MDFAVTHGSARCAGADSSTSTAAVRLHNEAVAEEARTARPAKVLRPQYLAKRPFEPALVAGPNGRSVPDSVSTAARSHRLQSLRTCR